MPCFPCLMPAWFCTSNFWSWTGASNGPPRHDDVCMRMMTVPGVGPIAVLTFKAAVDDLANASRRSRTVAVHFRASHHEDINQVSRTIPDASRERDTRDVRAIALCSGQCTCSCAPWTGSQIKSWGMRLMRTKGRRRAVVAVARKLAVLLHRMWADGTDVPFTDQVEGNA